MNITANSFSKTSGAFTGEVVAQFSPLEPDVPLRPAYAIFKPLPEIGIREIAVVLPGYQGDRDEVVTDETDWIVCHDWRGVPLYKTATGVKFFLQNDDINVLPSDVDATDLVPGADDSWSGSAWVLDQEKRLARLVAAAGSESEKRLSAAAAAIAPLQDAVDLGVATEDEVARLTLWRQYRVFLIRVPQQSGYPEQVEWPDAPA